MRRLATTLMALGLAVLLTASQRVCAQDVFPWTRNIPGDTRPISISADDGTAWEEQGKQILLLKGKVWVEQGDANFRATQAVVWIDSANQKQTGIYHVDVFGEGASLELAGSKNNLQAPSGVIALNTRGSLNIKTFKSKVAKTAMPDDPLYQRGLAALTGKPAAGEQNQIQQVSGPGQGFTPPKLPAQTTQTTPVMQFPGAPDPAAKQQPVVPGPGVPLPPGAVVPIEKPQAQFSIVPRSSQQIDQKDIPLGNGEKATVLRGGLIISIFEPATTKLQAGKLVEEPAKTIEIQADRVVLWNRGDLKQVMEGDTTGQSQTKRKLELYLSGNVEIRSRHEGIPNPKYPNKGREEYVVRCNEAYYDVSRNVAISLDADLEVRQPGLPNPIHVSVPELHQLSATFFEFPKSQINASTLPFGPGLYVTTTQGSLESKHIEKTSIFGARYVNSMTGEPEFEDELIFTGRNATAWLEGVPVFWLPYVQGDARDPLGPLESFSFGYSRVFGFELFTSWNMYDLLGIDPVPDTRWRLNLDYLSARGPEIGMDYGATGKNLFGIPGNYNILMRAMGIHDSGPDILGGNRGEFVVFGYPPPTTTLPITHPEWRGRILSNINWQELPFGLTVQGQLAAITDKNFLDQYYNLEWIDGLNQETFAYVKQQKDDWAWSVLVEPRIRNWITEAEWLPKVEGHIIGQDLLSYFTYTTRASAGYANLLLTHQQPLAFEPTDVSIAAGRFDWWNELALPFQAGAFKIVPYGVVDLTEYTKDIYGNNDFRFIGGGGIRGSIPFSRLYPEIQSELLNVNGIYHKIVLSGNYAWLHSDRSHLNFSQFDRVNDDESDQTLRDIRPQQPTLNPLNATMLNSGFFDPQLYALRKLVDFPVDTRDSIEVVQLDLRQRWQTKRGFPGMEHIIDWMTLDLGASFYPQADRDDFGKVVNFLEYDWSWNIGDRFTVFSSGWFDPHEGAARVWNFGTQMNRPDRSSLYLGYRQIDPLESKQVIAAATVPFSYKYSITASTSYDFGVNSQVNALTITRTGTDVMVSLGFTYNSILNNFGVVFEVVPNLLPATRRVPGMGNIAFNALRQGPQ
ncbi:MAG TPA: hypothetical protein VE988_12445 [Gemmataceae bacterium]|nr:hypothetical protein [Gemmataceae bacterium]